MLRKNRVQAAHIYRNSIIVLVIVSAIFVILVVVFDVLFVVVFSFAPINNICKMISFHFLLWSSFMLGYALFVALRWLRCYSYRRHLH